MAIAYGTAAPQLAVAEFAPSANREIEAPPTTDDSGVAARGGQAARRTTTTTTAPPAPTAEGGGTGTTAPTTRVGRSRTCYGNPPRQIEDPMSPPCVATIFESDNGGATAKGVSATEIRVAVPILSARGYRPADEATVNALFEYFNNHFELYGRRLVPVPVLGDPRTPVDARAHAADIVAHDVFAELNANQDWTSALPALPLTLAQAGVVTIVENMGTWWSDRTVFDPAHPYLWSVHPSSEDLQANLGDFACTSLMGQPATFAGDAGLRSTTRRLGVVAIGAAVVAPSASVLRNRLLDCTGQEPAFAQVLSSEGAALQTAMTRFKSDGVTTAFCVCETTLTFNGASAAHAAGFHPEWVLTQSFWAGNNDDEYGTQSNRQGDVIAPPMRLGAGPRLLPTQARPWFQALQTVNPALGSTASEASQVWALAGPYYEQLLVLASGIQGAGPALTAANFAAALMATPFSNPGAGQPPYWQPSAGFGPGDHSFYDDYFVSWWSDTAAALNYPASNKAVGSWCYVGQGQRFRPGTYPAATANVLFNPNLPCR